MTKRNIQEHIVVYIKGFLMGCAEIIPGVSGSTVALIMGIYDDFINILYSISEIVKTTLLLPTKQKSLQDLITLIKQFRFTFTIFLALGMFSAIILLSNAIIYLLHEFPHYMSAILLGLVLSVLALPLKILGKPNLKEALVIVSSFLVIFFILGLKPSESIDQNTLPSLWNAFVGGFFGISAMVLPGISGSFVLLIMGLYFPIVSLLKEIITLNISIDGINVLVVLLLGMFTGLTIVSQLLKKAIDNNLRLFLAFVTGLILASARALWPFVKKVEEDGKSGQIIVDPSYFETLEVGLIMGTVTFITMFFGYVNWKFAKI